MLCDKKTTIQPIENNFNCRVLETVSPQTHKGAVFWLTGLSGAGKTTLAFGAEKSLLASGMRVITLDGDMMRQGLCADLGFSLEARRENVRRVAHVAALIAQAGYICLCACIAPMREYRHLCRKIIGPCYHEIFIDCPLEICRQRDVKGLYAKVNAGLINEYTGISSPYERPEHPDLILQTHTQSVELSLKKLEKYIYESNKTNNTNKLKRSLLFLNKKN